MTVFTVLAAAAAAAVVVFIFDWSFYRGCGGHVGGIVVEGGLHYYINGGGKEYCTVVKN